MKSPAADPREGDGWAGKWNTVLTEEERSALSSADPKKRLDAVVSVLKATGSKP